MSGTAKIFRSGNSQAVRLPKEYRFDEDVSVVSIRRQGDGIVLEPPRQRKFSARFWRSIGSLPNFKRPQQVPQGRRKIFP
jgi:virulence-associated protein VagC